MPHGTPDTRLFPWDQPLANHLRQLNSGMTGGINTWDINPSVGVDGTSLDANDVGYTGINTNTASLVRWDGSAWTTLMDGDRIVSTPQLDVYVSQNTGNDNNDGKTASTAWQTISKFYQEINKFNLLSKQVNLYLGAGTYSVQFPPSTWGGTIRVYGASSGSTIIQRMLITKGTFCMLQDVTLTYPQVLDSSPFFWCIDVDDSSTLQLGQNIVLGPIGNFTAGWARFHIQVSNNSRLFLFASHPITLTGSVNNVFFLKGGSTMWVSTYYNPTAGVSTPNPAPGVNTGAVYTYFPPLTTAHTVAMVNAVGNLTVGNFFCMDGSNVNGAPGWRLQLNGSVVGAAFALLNTSSINGYVVRGAAPTPGIGYPTSISSGTKDATSVIIGPGF